MARSRPAESSDGSDFDMDALEEEEDGTSSDRPIYVRLGSSNWGLFSRRDGEDEDEDGDDEDDVEALRSNPLAVLLRWFNRSRETGEQREKTEMEPGKGKPKKPKKEKKPGVPHVNLPLPEEEDLRQKISSACDLGRQAGSSDLVHRLMEREYGGTSSPSGRSWAVHERGIAQHLLPRVTGPEQVVAHAQSSVFCGKYSPDGNLLVLGCQDGGIPVYLTEAETFRHHCTVQARYVGWTVIEVAFSHDNRHICYGTWSPLLHHCSVMGDEVTQHPLDLRPNCDSFAVFGIFYTPGGGSIAASGSDGCIYVYDMHHGDRIHQVPAHEDHANALCCSTENPNIMYSGGDDGLCKVWDRRELSEHGGRAVAVFAGHRDGVTFIDATSDGRYILTNSKDQSVKLWDLRSPSPSEGLHATRQAVSHQQWDYRWQVAPKKLGRMVSCEKLSGDVSLMTYTGHQVQHTLIRARFSPQHSTGERYIYTGGSGRAVIYDILTGKKVQELPAAVKQKGRARTIRDVSWHPYQPHLVTSGWDGTVRLWSPSNVRCRVDCAALAQQGEDFSSSEEDSEGFGQ